ncbi:MAG: hypothetical protein KC502_06040 [Myxococcales bacterium]|nr:hypothetical protein [Myxococcales bacterium]
MNTMTFSGARMMALASTLAFAACAEAPVQQVQTLPAAEKTADKPAEKVEKQPEAGQEAKATEKLPTAHENGPRVNPDQRSGKVTTGTVVDLKPLDEPEATEGGATGGIAVGMAPTDPPAARVRRRMNIDQLDAALKRVTGGPGWVAANKKNELTTLSLTLGKPNYTDMTTEDLEPSALFQKFLADAAQSVCMKVAAGDMAQKTASKRNLMRHVSPKDTWASNPKAVNANLAWLMLRFHSRMVAPTATELEPWRFLFETATKVSGNKPDQAWRTVCVALVVHPHFYTY